MFNKNTKTTFFLLASYFVSVAIIANYDLVLASFLFVLGALCLLGMFVYQKYKQRKIMHQNSEINHTHDFDLKLLKKAFENYKNSLIEDEKYEECIVTDNVLQTLKNGNLPNDLNAYEIHYLKFVTFKKDGSMEFKHAYNIVGKK
jgi:hypothetical protein